MGTIFDKYGNEIKTISVFNPGEFLLEEIEERGLKKTDFPAEIKCCRVI